MLSLVPRPIWIRWISRSNARDTPTSITVCTARWVSRNRSNFRKNTDAIAR
ncbi:hypothetical protein EES40_36560 [Streptomyces sp. ADI93-02]|nr:hypothetical protein EES40_36560 [Streptomyces sp. ADI93-02]